MDRSPRTVNAIVDEQIQRWQAAQAKARAGAVAEPTRPLITIERQYGARGAALAHLIAEKLGFAYWNRQLVDEMARHARASTQAFNALDEHHRSPIAATLGEMVYSAEVGPQDYARELTRVVRAIDEHGGAVIVGHGAQYLVSPEHALRVRVVCPLDQRIAGVAERAGLSQAEARDEIASVDRDRSGFVRDHFARDVDDPSAYDLSVNTALGMSVAADIVIAAYRVRFPPR